jgi:hypothetical protein
MMKIYKLLFFSIFILGVVLFPQRVHANEGKFSIMQSSVDCEGVSVWQSGAYQITGICSGLVYPYHDQLTGYALWVQPDTGGAPVRVASIDRGLISASTNQRFTGMFVTAESSSNPRSPSSYRIVSGNLTLFNFPLPYQNQTNNQGVVQTQAQTGHTVTPTPTMGALSANSIQSPFKTGSIALLVLAGVIVVMVFGIMYFVKSRSSGA